MLDGLLAEVVQHIAQDLTTTQKREKERGKKRGKESIEKDRNSTNERGIEEKKNEHKQV